MTSGGPEEADTVDHDTYRVIEIVGTSEEAVDDAIRSGIARASTTLTHLDWFELGATADIEDGSMAWTPGSGPGRSSDEDTTFRDRSRSATKDHSAGRRAGIREGSSPSVDGRGPLLHSLPHRVPWPGSPTR
jgi:dodecin